MSKDIGFCSITEDLCKKDGKCEDCSLKHIHENIEHYAKLHEENRLIELPCVVGEEVWIGHKIYSFGESVIKVMYNSVSSIIVAMQDGFVFGRTKEEAEAKLKELEGDKE